MLKCQTWQAYSVEFVTHERSTIQNRRTQSLTINMYFVHRYIRTSICLLTMIHGYLYYMDNSQDIRTSDILCDYSTDIGVYMIEIMIC